MQEDVALFATELLRLKAQIMCLKFQPQTILQYAAAQQMTPADQELIPQALQLLQDKPLRNFRIDVAADSLVQIDEQQMKQERMEFLQAFGGFLQQALPVGQNAPQMVPVMAELMRFGMQAFKSSRPIEGQLDQALQQMNQMAGQPQPNPEAEAAQAAAQMEMQRSQAEMQMEQAKMAAQQQLEQQKAQLEAQLKQAELAAQQQIEQLKAQTQMQIEQQRQAFEAQLKERQIAAEQEMARFKAELDAQTKIAVARISANPGVDIAGGQVPMTADIAADLTNKVSEAMDRMAVMNGDTMTQIARSLEMLKAPKRIIRGPDGRAAGVEIVQMDMYPEPEMRQ